MGEVVTNIVDNGIAILMLVIAVVLSFCSTTLVVWKVKPLQKGVLWLVTSSMNAVFAPYVASVANTAKRITDVEEELKSVEKNVADTFSKITMEQDNLEEVVDHKIQLTNQKIDSLATLEQQRSNFIDRDIALLRKDIIKLKDDFSGGRLR